MRTTILAVALLLAACTTAIDAERERMAATQAVVDERVRVGQMTEAEGRMVMANVKFEMESARRRNAAILNSDGGGTYQPVGGGTVVRY